jgi:hypothetical protein
VGGSATIVASLITRRYHRRQHLRSEGAEAAEAAAAEAALMMDETEPGTALGVA